MVNTCLVGLLAIGLAVCPTSVAIQANAIPFQVRQPNGTVVTLQLAGDDRLRYQVDPNGYRVEKQKVQGKDSFVYAMFDATASSVVVTAKEVCMYVYIMQC